MYLRYYLNDKQVRVYTIKKIDPEGQPTLCAHPAKFSPHDLFSEQRVTLQRRFKILRKKGPKAEKKST